MEMVKELESLYNKFKELNIEQKYFPFSSLESVLEHRDEQRIEIGQSFLGNSIYKITVGNGAKRILIWSQMHGNESTGTRSMFDVLNFLQTNHSIAQQILNNLTIDFVPMLNPDGANVYTRRNAIGIDINRDFIQNASPEIQLLKQIVGETKYEFLFNLHDQRTIFNIKGTKNPATLSFLSPSGDIEETITDIRKDVMGVIAEMNMNLQMLISENIGRYNHAFYPTATGDNFTKQGERCILFEAGHFPNDYNRNKTRKYNAIAILLALNFIATTDDYQTSHKEYFKIPENDTQFLDILIRNIVIESNENQSTVDLGIYFTDEFDGKRLKRIAKITEIGDLSMRFGHLEIDAKGEIYKSNTKEKFPNVNRECDFTFGNFNINQEFINSI